MTTVRPPTAPNPSYDSLNAVIFISALDNVPLLNSDNFSFWKTSFHNLLELQGLLDPLTKDYCKLSPTQEIQLRTILVSKLDSSVQVHILTAEKRSDAKLIWKAVSMYFASKDASNRARVFREFSRIKFDPDEIPEFITKVKIANIKLADVGVIIPEDIEAYMILEKLPPLLDTISQQITHSDKYIEIDMVLDHLRNFFNDSSISASVSVKNEFSSLLTTSAPSRKCKNGWHNPIAPHPEHKCWMLYPKL